MTIVRDSSIWENKTEFEVARKRDMSIRIGMVRQEKFDTNLNATQYIVEVLESGNQMPVLCTRMERFGGIFNFEEYSKRPYNISKGGSELSHAVRPGDTVIIAFFNGDSREGVILGGIRHPGRKQKLKPSDDQAYISEFNGVETSINNSGEYKVTFKAVPTNVAELLKPPTGDNIPPATYDTAIGGSYFQFDKTGSYSLTDSSQSGVQSLKIDKPGGTITVTSGDVVIKMDKNAKLIDVKTKDFKMLADSSITCTTKDVAIFASATAKLKSPKVAIGTDGIELLDEIVQLIDKLAKVVVYSPVGPCQPFGTSEQWPDVDKVKQDINKIKGSL